MNSEFRVLVRPAPESTAICPSDAERRRFRRKTCLSDLKGQEYARKAYKPDFVPVARQAMTIPLTAPLPMRLQLPTRTCWGRRAPPLTRRSAARGPYLALLPVGLAVPELLPAPRWALTPPFHPYPSADPAGPDRRAVSFLWRFPSGCPARALPGTVSSWSPDFPLRRLCPAKATPRMSHMRVTGVVVGHATRVDAAAIQPSAHPRPRRRRVARQWGRAGRQGLRG